MLIVAPHEEVDGCPGGGGHQRAEGCRAVIAPLVLTLGCRMIGSDQPCVGGSFDGQAADGPEILQNSECGGNTIDDRFMRLLIEGLVNDDTRLVQQVGVIDE